MERKIRGLMNVLEVLYQSWSDTLLRELRNLSQEQKQPFARDAMAVKKRKEENDPNSIAFLLKTQQIANLFPNEQSEPEAAARYIAEIRDLYQLLISRGPPHTELQWIHLPAQLHVPTVVQLRDRYRALHPTRKNLGTDDFLVFLEKVLWFCTSRSPLLVLY